MFKYTFFIIAFYFTMISASGQNEVQLSQYMLNYQSINPAAIARNNFISASGLHRQQWIGLPNAPQSTHFSVNMPIRLFDYSHGLGLAFYNNSAGLFTMQSVALQYAFKYPINEGVLSIGGLFGFLSQGFNGENVAEVTSDYHSVQDPIVPTQNVNGVAGDISLGCFYTLSDFYAGIAMYHVTQPTIDISDNLNLDVSRVFNLMGGQSFLLSNIRYQLKPSFLLKTDFVSFQTDVNLLIEKDSKYWIGLSWRLQDAIVFMVGGKLSNGASIGYSYDLPTTEFISNSYGSHELFLNYEFSLVKGKTNKYKSVRIL